MPARNQLYYEALSDADRTPSDLVTPAWRVVRRLCFAVGLTLLFGGVGHGCFGSGDAAVMMGWGGFFVGLCVPLGRWSWS